MKKFKENQTVYYCINCYVRSNNEIKVKYYPTAYEWHEIYADCFDMNLLFDNKEDAEEKAKQLNGE